MVTRAQLARTALMKRGFILVCFLVALYLLWADYHLYLKVREAYTLRESAEQQLAYLSARREKLSGEIGELSTERGKETYLRGQFLVGKEGEHVVIISGMDEEKSGTQGVATTTGASEAWWHW